MIDPAGFIGQIFVVILLVILAIFVVTTLFRAIRIVPQARAGVVERLGKYRKTLLPGLNILVPFIDRMLPLIDLRASCFVPAAASHHRGQPRRLH